MTDNHTQPDLEITVYPSNKYALGLSFGIVTGLVYIILLLIKYNFFSYSPIAYNIFAFIAYLIILALYFICGTRRRKQLGGYAETKELFPTLFVAILITEFIYVAFNYVYLSFVDPEFMNKYLQATYDYLLQRGANTEAIEAQMDKLQEQSHSITNIKYTAMGFGIWVVIDGIICLIFSLGLRKPKPQY